MTTKAETTRNIYQKLVTMRAALQQRTRKKSGESKFAGWSYFELSDFLPDINTLAGEHGLCPVVTFSADEATLTLINVDDPTARIIFASPMAGANLKGCHPIQNLGAVETYQRRYLYMLAFEIVAHDAIDSSEPVETPDPPAGYDEWMLDLEAAGDEGPAAVKTAWEASRKDLREWATAHDADRLAAIKATAKNVAAKE